MCNGGCPKDRIVQPSAGEPGLNYLCAGYRRFFTYCRPYTLKMAELRWSGQPPQLLMEQLRAEKTRPKAGRNDLCPCGSGRKFKKCCLMS